MANTITALDAAQLLTLVAPGYFATVGYGWVFPQQRAREQLPVLLASVALSLPLVALGRLLARGLELDATPTKAPFVALLVGISLIAGYGAGQLRAAPPIRRVLLRVGHHLDPEVSVLARTVQQMPSDTAQVTINFKDGRRLGGTPRHAADGELYLDHTCWWNIATGVWGPRRSHGGVLVRLDEVQSIELDEDPV